MSRVKTPGLQAEDAVVDLVRARRRSRRSGREHRHRAEGLLAQTALVVGDVLEQGRLEHRAVALAAAEERRAGGRRRARSSRRAAPPRFSEIIGPMKVSSSRGSPDLQRRVAATSSSLKLVVDALVDEDALHADAALAGLVEGADDDAVDGVVDVGVLVDDAGGVAAELEHRPSSCPARALSSQPTSGEPVKLSSFSRSSVVKRSAPSRRQGRIENAPFGQVGLGEDLADDQRADRASGSPA